MRNWVEQEVVDRSKLRLKLWSRSRYFLAARSVMSRIGLKYVGMLVYERPLDTEIPVVETKVAVEVRLVSSDDVKNGHYQGVKLASGDDPSQHDKALRRLKNGDICFAAIVEHTVAGFAWLYMQKKKYEPGIETEISLEDRESLIYDRLVFPEFRGNGIGEKLNEERINFLKARGFKKVYGYVCTDNIISIKSVKALGLYPTRIITCLKVFGIKRITEQSINRGALNK